MTKSPNQLVTQSYIYTSHQLGFKKSLACWASSLSEESHHGLINCTDTKAKCRHLKNWPIKGRQVFICLRPPPLLGFCLGWSGNFVGSESGQTQRVKLLQQYSTPQPLPATYCPACIVCTVYCTLTQGRGEGGGEKWTREKFRGATVHTAGLKKPPWLTVSPVYKLW
jgi:hypothetical protein